MHQSPSKRRFDHLVLPSRDLEAQAAVYRRLGFQVGARNVHPWGTENRLVQFDGCFLELISMGGAATPPDHKPRRFSFGAHVRDRLARDGDGMSMLAFDAHDAASEAEWLARAGLAEFAPFHFGRKGLGPSGAEIDVAFTLAFAAPPVAPDLCFFFCQHHHPENFWTPALQRHENTALGVARIVVVRDEPQMAGAFVKSVLGGAPRFETEGVTMQMAHGALSFWSPAAARAAFGGDPIFDSGGQARFAAVVISVRSIEAAELALRAGDLPHRRASAKLVVPSAAAFGVLLAFEESTEPR